MDATSPVFPAPRPFSDLASFPGGERGIRTLGTVARTHDFQSCTFGHSVISPMDPSRAAGRSYVACAALSTPPLTMGVSPCTLRGGELSEWPKEPDSKSGVPARVPWVRIPRSPQRFELGRHTSEWALGLPRSLLFRRILSEATPAHEGREATAVERRLRSGLR
jgi:hypothetical protein